MSLRRKQIGCLYTAIDIPYSCIGKCFYCGEPANTIDHFPPVSRYHDFMAIYNTHRAITVPCCSECNTILSSSLQKDIFERADECKVKLSVKLNKFIKYSKIWDEEDSFEYAEFTGNFKTFAEGVSQLSHIAKQRIEWVHWNVSFDGVELEKSDSVLIQVDGKNFKSLDHVLEYARKIYKIPTKYLEDMIDILGKGRIDYAIRLCVASPVKNQHQMKTVLDDVREAEAKYGSIYKANKKNDSRAVVGRLNGIC